MRRQLNKHHVSQTMGGLAEMRRKEGNKQFNLLSNFLVDFELFLLSQNDTKQKMGKSTLQNI